MTLKPLGPNVTLLTLADDTQVLFSYETPVACFIPGEGYFVTTTKYSNTTTRHIHKCVKGPNLEVTQEFINNLVKGV